MAKLWAGAALADDRADMDEGVTSLDLNATEIVSSGSLGYDLGTFNLTIKTESGEVPASGKYLVVCIRAMMELGGCTATFGMTTRRCTSPI